jgi:hypothetical protein
MSEPERTPSTFWTEHKTAEELAADQGITPKTEADLDRMFGAGADLWESDEEFEEFVEGIYARRAEGRRHQKSETQSGAA